MPIVRLLAVLNESHLPLLEEYLAYHEDYYGPVWKYDRNISGIDVTFIIHFLGIVDNNVPKTILLGLSVLPEIHGVLLLDTSVAYPKATSLGSYDTEKIIPLGSSFFIQRCLVETVDGLSTFGPADAMIQNFTQSHNMRSVVGFSTDAVITEPIFDQYRKFCYTVAVADKHTAVLYQFAKHYDVTSQVLSMTVVQSYAHSEDDTWESEPRSIHGAIAALIDDVATIYRRDGILGYLIRQSPMNKKVIADYRFDNPAIASPGVIPIAGEASSNRATLSSSVPAAAASTATGSPSIAPPVAPPVASTPSVTSTEKDDLANEIDLLTKTKMQKTVDVNSLRSQIEMLEEEKMKLVMQLNAAENARTQSEREHIGMLSDMINNRDKKNPQGDDERHLCKMCYTNDVNTVVLPCSHAVICSVCSDKLANNSSNAEICLICRGKVDRVIKYVLA